jgi:hypothetical protein
MKEMGKLGGFETQVKYNHPYHQNTHKTSFSPMNEKWSIKGKPTMLHNITREKHIIYICSTSMFWNIKDGKNYGLNSQL